MAPWVRLALLGWVSMLGTDLLLHAGLLARLYTEPSPFLLRPIDAFLRIPLGLVSFLLLAFLLSHLMIGSQVSGWRAGLRFGLGVGVAVWGALVLGLASISTAPWALLAGWFVGQSVELGIAGAVIGAGIGGTPLRTLWVWVAGWCVAAFAVTMILQNVGLAPAEVVGR